MWSKIFAIFGPGIGIRNSASHCSERIRMTSKWWIGLDPSHANKPTRWSQQKGNTLGSDLQLMGSHTKLEIFRITECFPSSRLRGMLGFHNRSSLGFTLTVCLRKPYRTALRDLHANSSQFSKFWHSQMPLGPQILPGTETVQKWKSMNWKIWNLYNYPIIG